MPATVSAVIVNFNGLKTISGCLESLIGQSTPPEEIIVVDNASADGSPDEIRQHFPEVKLIEQAQNLGYTGACNLGIGESHGDLVAVLNNDLQLDPEWLSNLKAEVKEPWSFWASKIVFASNPDIIDSAGDAMAVIGSAYKVGHGDKAQNFTQDREVFGPCGAAALYRRSMLEDVGLFDPDFFLVYEDADLSMRARLKGYRCLFVANAQVHHQVNQSIGKFSHTYVYYGHRNSEFVYWKNMPTSLLLRYLPERKLFNLLCFAFFARHGRGGSFLKAKLDFLRLLPRTVEKRRTIQKSKSVSTDCVRSFLDRNWFRYRRKVSIGQ